MYERSAVVLERYFAQSFYYNEKNKLTNNYENYRQLIEVLEKYQDVSEAEDKIIRECEDIASQIKLIQKNQSSLYRKNIKLQEDRNLLFENIDESAIELGKQLDKIEKDIDKSNAKMRPIDQEFIDTIAKFNDKSEIRSECGKKRKIIEKDYRNLLEKTNKNINEIDPKNISEIKKITKLEDNTLNIELKDIMLKNGEKEKEQFDSNVIEKSIVFAENLYSQEANILTEIYDKTNSLLNEINNNAVRIKKYKKLSKKSRNVIEFLNIQKEYLTQFLDNERLSVGLGKKEHKKLMKEACNDFDKDTKQINNLNKLLLEEIAGEASVKMYEELYSAEYLTDLQKQEDEFERKLRKLNMTGRILNPIYWRIVGIEKIYSVFDEIVSTEYQRDLSDFKIESSQVNYVIEEPENKEPEKSKRTKKEKIEEVDEEIEDSQDIMEYYDNLDSDSDDSEDDYEYDGIYPTYRNEMEQEDNDEQIDLYNDEEVEEDDEENDTFFKNFYDDDDDFYDNDNEDVYEDLETILKNRKRRLSKSRVKKARTNKKRGIFGFGVNK